MANTSTEEEVGEKGKEAVGGGRGRGTEKAKGGEIHASREPCTQAPGSLLLRVTNISKQVRREPETIAIAGLCLPDC